MSFDALKQRLSELPLLKIACCMAVGIVLQRFFDVPTLLILLALLVTGLGSILLHSRVAYLLALTAGGYLIAEIGYKPDAVPYHEQQTLQIRITDDGTPRTRYTRHEARLESWMDADSDAEHPNGGRLWLYADTTLHLRAGMRLRYDAKIYPFYQDSTTEASQMTARGYLGRCYLYGYDYYDPLPSSAPTLHQKAARRLEAQLATKNDASALVRAMTVGDRSDIQPPLREQYARSGLSHLMALSGLHTGMLFLLINLLLWWLPLLHRGHRLKHLLSIGAVWLFVAAAGFPVSALRAAVMCTMLQWALLSSSNYRALNSWAAAAVLLLALRPSWLFDLSFQLSFLAVWAILCWGVPLCRALHGRFRILNYISDALLISLVASIATAPLIAHQFGMIPLLGVLINPPAILLATAIVALGLLLLLLPPLTPVLQPLVLQLATWQNLLAERCAALACSSIEVHLSGTATSIIYLFFLVLTLVAWCRDRKKSVHL